MVVLKRLADALADGDQIYAVIKGHALNNDGAAEGQLRRAERERRTPKSSRSRKPSPASSPDTISYIEAHGTATPLGDPIEIAGLTQAFRDDDGRAAVLRARLGEGKHRPLRRRLRRRRA